MADALDTLLQHHLSGHFLDMAPSHTRRPEPMDHLLIWVLRGRFHATAGDDAIAAGPGDLVLFEPGVPQEYRSEESREWEWLWVHFGGAAAGDLCQRVRAFGGPCVRLGHDDHIRRRFGELLASAPIRTYQAEGSSLLVNTCLVSLMGLMLHRLELAQRAPADVPRLDVTALQRTIHDRLAEPLTVEDLAAEAKLSPAHFSRTFRSLLGVSPMRYVIQLRMDRAATLLTTTGLKLAEIARLVGYDDPYYFSRLFKKTIGVAPSDYRRAAEERG